MTPQTKTKVFEENAISEKPQFSELGTVQASVWASDGYHL